MPFHHVAEQRVKLIAEKWNEDRTRKIVRMEVLRISPVLGVHTGPGIVGTAVMPLNLIEGGSPQRPHRRGVAFAYGHRLVSVELDAFTCDPVNIRCLDIGSSKATQISIAEIIGIDQDNIG